MLNPINVPAKLLQINSGEKRKVKKLIKGNLKGDQFIEHLRENLEFNNDPILKNKNKISLKGNPPFLPLLKK